MLKVYTDGASRGNPGKGGWGVVGFYKDKILFEVGGSAKAVTNNQMELTAMIKGIKFVADNLKSFIDLQIAFKSVEMYTDSQYVVKGMNDWRASWIKNNWKNSQKKDVMNRELWEGLINAEGNLKHLGVSTLYKHVKGHAGDLGNERADTIATECADASSSHLVNIK